MNEDDFVNKLLTDFQNGTLFMDQSGSVKISDSREEENQMHDDEDEDHDPIYVHEEIVRPRKSDECVDVDDDTKGDDRLYYESEATQAEDIEEKEEEEKEAEEEYQWMNEEATRIYVEVDEDGGGYADDDEEEKDYGDVDIDVGDDEIVVEEEDGEDEVLDSEEEGFEDGEEKEMIIQSSRKKRRIDYYLDRLSNLNDDTILHIMSFLPMKDNVKTGILSQRWEYLWTSLSTLIFEHCSITMDKGEIWKFLDFVNYTLLLCTCENIKKIVLNFLFLSSHTMLVNRTIRFVTLRRAEDVCLRFRGNNFREKYELPQHFFTNSSLKALSLFNCIIEPREKIHWRTIKSLTLECIELYTDILSKVLKGSPNLEYLKISSCMCDGVGNLKICSENLKELVISFTLDSLVDLGDDTVLEIWAPRLKLLSLLGNFYKKRCRLVNVASLSKADLSFKCDDTDKYEENREFLFNLLQSLEHVKDLKLGIWCTQLLSTDRQYLFLRLKFSCKTLTLHTTLMSFEGNFRLELLLLGFTCLETLEIDMSCGSNLNIFVENKHGHRFAGTLVLLFPHLKTLRITNFGPEDEKYVFRLVKMILENAKELETVAIKPGNLGYSEWSSFLGSQSFIQLSRKILRIPRCSPKAAILI